MTYKEQSQSQAIKENPHPNPCVNSKNVGLHNWTPMAVPIFVIFGGKTIRVGEGVTCAWSDWSDDKKRRLECWSGPHRIKNLVDNVTGFSREMWRKEVGKGPSLVKDWGWHFLADKGFRNYNQDTVNGGDLHWAIEPRVKTSSNELRSPSIEAAQAYQPEMPTLEEDVPF